MGVSKNRGTPKWMVYNGKPYFLMDDLEGKPTIFGNIHIHTYDMYVFFRGFRTGLQRLGANTLCRCQGSKGKKLMVYFVSHELPISKDARIANKLEF